MSAWIPESQGQVGCRYFLQLVFDPPSWFFPFPHPFVPVIGAGASCPDTPLTGGRGHLRCEALMNSTTGPGRPVATYLRDWRTLGGIRPSGLAFFSECHPVHTRRSPGTGWSD